MIELRIVGSEMRIVGSEIVNHGKGVSIEAFGFNLLGEWRIEEKDREILSRIGRRIGQRLDIEGGLLESGRNYTVKYFVEYEDRVLWNQVSFRTMDEEFVTPGILEEPISMDNGTASTWTQEHWLYFVIIPSSGGILILYVVFCYCCCLITLTCCILLYRSRRKKLFSIADAPYDLMSISPTNMDLVLAQSDDHVTKVKRFSKPSSNSIVFDTPQEPLHLESKGKQKSAQKKLIAYKEAKKKAEKKLESIETIRQTAEKQFLDEILNLQNQIAMKDMIISEFKQSKNNSDPPIESKQSKKNSNLPSESKQSKKNSNLPSDFDHSNNDSESPHIFNSHVLEADNMRDVDTFVEYKLSQMDLSKKSPHEVAQLRKKIRRNRLIEINHDLPPDERTEFEFKQQVKPSKQIKESLSSNELNEDDDLSDIENFVEYKLSQIDLSKKSHHEVAQLRKKMRRNRLIEIKKGIPLDDRTLLEMTQWKKDQKLQEEMMNIRSMKKDLAHENEIALLKAKELLRKEAQEESSNGIKSLEEKYREALQQVELMKREQEAMEKRYKELISESQTHNLVRSHEEELRRVKEQAALTLKEEAAKREQLALQQELERQKNEAAAQKEKLDEQKKLAEQKQQALEEKLQQEQEEKARLLEKKKPKKKRRIKRGAKRTIGTRRAPLTSPRKPLTSPRKPISRRTK